MDEVLGANIEKLRGATNKIHLFMVHVLETSGRHYVACSMWASNGHFPHMDINDVFLDLHHGIKTRATLEDSHHFFIGVWLHMCTFLFGGIYNSTR